MSPSKVSAILKNIRNKNIQIQTPSQTGVYKALKLEAGKVKQKMISSRKNAQWALHFDGKVFKGKDREVALLKNRTEEIYLGVLSLENGKSETTFNGLKDLINKY